MRMIKVAAQGKFFFGILQYQASFPQLMEGDLPLKDVVKFR